MFISKKVGAPRGRVSRGLAIHDFRLYLYTVRGLHIICRVLQHNFPYWALDSCCSNIKVDRCNMVSDQQIQFTVIFLHVPCTLIVYICSVLRHYFPYWALDCCCSNIKLDGCDIASFNQRWLVSDQKVTDFSNFPQAQNTMGMKFFVLCWFEIH